MEKSRSRKISFMDIFILLNARLDAFILLDATKIILFFKLMPQCTILAVRRRSNVFGDARF